MRAVRFDRFGGPEVLQTVDLPEPTPEEDEVVVRLVAAGVNHLDLDIRAGTSRLPVSLPHQLGREGSG